VVRREVFPPHTASGLWLEGDTYDVIVIDKRAAAWHQIVIFCHEVWHMHQRTAHPVPSPASDGSPRPVAARTDFSLADEQEADRFGMLMSGRLRPWLESAAVADPAHGPAGADDGTEQGVAGRIGAALNYRGTRK
jgi:hypothetical protein